MVCHPLFSWSCLLIPPNMTMMVFGYKDRWVSILELLEAIQQRRSIRKFTEQTVDKGLVQELIDVSVWAPSASNEQPWGFVIVQDQVYLNELSTAAKSGILEKINVLPALEQYRSTMENQAFNIFYNAPALVIFYGKKDDPHTDHDCSMAAQNFMLAAREKELGTCWIGFAEAVCASDEFKTKHHIPEDYKLVAPIILGYPDHFPQNSISRKDYPVFSWVTNN